ncbi:hypothetical protein Bacsa_3576 [Phocaeicola salanitronis DSM 18170]|uniref:Uncharacterized protein n=1 Tax=Phocaeicola salanitronis (strain DSM 18170 / JCM 13657 / CCUG 60908 / BL78) TaxID=667015 RepID=F0R8B4_PHOSB|nr:hypothetical protein [Phocaeicola salanitronis]ADY38098.1 hypothetical protein Bacsa_3576 [Phocaeicola salanitronis DSM 18170]
MKTRNKLYDKSRLRLLCLLTALLGLFGAGQTWAGNPTTLTVGGTNALNGGYWLTNADGTLTPDGASADNYNVYYDGNGTLTLKDATINGTATTDHVGAGIYAEGDLTIVLEGSSTVKGVVDPYGESQSIRVSGNLTIQGGGSLTAQGAETSSGSNYGISVVGSFTQQSGSVTAISGTSKNYYSEGLYVFDGTVTVEGGTLTATGGNAGSSYGSSGISTNGTVTVNDAIVTATGGNAGSSYGISTNGTVTVSDATVTATSGSAGYASYGLYIESSSPSVTLSGSSSLTARSGTATNTAGGIYFENLFGSTRSVTVGENSTLLTNSVIFRDSSFNENPLAPTGDGSWLIYGQSDQTSAVGGNYTLEENLTIENGNTFTIPAGSTLTIPEDKTLTADANQLVVNGELVLEGTFENANELTGTGNLVLGEITLTDDEGIGAYEDYHLKLKSKKVTYTRALPVNSQYGTICLPFVPTSVTADQVTYYQVLELGSNEITLVETDFEAGKPLFYQTSGTGSITFSAESAAGVELVTTPATDSFMVGTMSVYKPTAGYFLKNGNFYPITDGVQVKVKSFRAYVKGQNDASQASVMSVNVARP